MGFDFDLDLLLFAIEREGFDEVLPTTNSTNTGDASQSIAFDLRKWSRSFLVELSTSGRLQNPFIPSVQCQIQSVEHHGRLVWELKITGLTPPPNLTQPWKAE
ncbi:hypothetical protein F4824DRAFT_496514 [Ustulina deusta]|nr:hypothetical protein F4824DRAFT_496514 [Ustulina deusta]